MKTFEEVRPATFTFKTGDIIAVRKRDFIHNLDRVVSTRSWRVRAESHSLWSHRRGWRVLGHDDRRELDESLVLEVHSCLSFRLGPASCTC